MPLTDYDCPNCENLLHSDELWFENPRTGRRECHHCGQSLEGDNDPRVEKN